jgi:FKBP-type peptidyl-prolyl cis-trans isomerase
MASEVQRTVIKDGNGKDQPKQGDKVTMEYTGWLYESGKPENKGKQSAHLRQFPSISFPY